VAGSLTNRCAASMRVTAMTRLIAVIVLLTFAVFLTACISGAPRTALTDQQRKIADINERALYSMDKGDTIIAEQMFSEALRLSASLDDREGQTVALLNMTRLSRRNNDIQTASDLADRAIKISEGTDMYSDALQEKALQELQAGRLESACKLAEMSLQKEPGPLKGRRLNLLARIACKAGKTEICRRYLEQALAANGSDILAVERGNTLRLMGTLNSAGNRYEIAEQQLNEALRIDRDQAMPVKIAEDLEALAELYKRTGDQKKAESFMERAKRVRKSILESKKNLQR